MKKRVLLSFDVEEFDLPKEYGAEITLERGVEISARGLVRILDLLKRRGVKATFFVTGNFAKARSDLIVRMRDEGHEVACHGVDHFNPRSSDVEESKKIVEKVIGASVVGYRQPRMGEIDYKELKRCGYLYDSSVNPALIPGRYNHMRMPRTPFMREDIVEIPTSVAWIVRVPLFWLALHLFPVKMYCRMAHGAMRKTGYFATYFHPWEFSDELAGWREVPGYIKKNSGKKLVERLGEVIDAMKECEFMTYEEFAMLVKQL